MTATDDIPPQFYHGTRADLKPGDLIQPSYPSNYTERRSPWVYFSETLHAATWGAELGERLFSGEIDNNIHNTTINHPTALETW
jgi:hypothetical protein